LALRETWYFGGGSSMDTVDDVLALLDDFLVREDSVLGFDVEVDFEGLGMSSALVFKVDI
jgi:hypothetical protein